MDKLMDKLVTAGISMVGGLVATKAFEFTWRQITGEEAPKDADNDDISLQKALVFGISSAAISAGVQVLSQRGAKSTLKKMHANKEKKQAEV